jgi:transposase
MRIGQRAKGTQKIGYDYAYLYVSIKPFTGEVFALILPSLNKECFNLFADLRSQKLERKTLMVLDGATAHRLEESELIEITKIPPYSPELNPVERFFQELRRRLKFKVFETIEQAEEYISEKLQEFIKDKQSMRKLTLYPYIANTHSLS